MDSAYSTLTPADRQSRFEIIRQLDTHNLEVHPDSAEAKCVRSALHFLDATPLWFAPVSADSTRLKVSVWLLDSSKEYVLLRFNSDIEEWTTPGGMPGSDESLKEAVLRHNQQILSSGIQLQQDGTIFDVDAYLTPTEDDEDDKESEYLTYDVRLLATADKMEPEAADLRWFKLHDLQDAQPDIKISMAIRRMIEKTAAL